MDFNSNQYDTYSQNAFYQDQGSFEVDNPFLKSENKVLSKVFLQMTLGLAISAFSALVGYQFLGQYVQALYLPLIVLELILVLGFSFGINKMSAMVAKVCFFAYSIVNDLTLSSLFYYYEIGSIYSTFFVAAAMFGVTAFYGYVTKKDLSGIGTYLLMGLVGLIIASLVNLFLHNSMLEFGITIVGLLIFIGLTAYDVYKVKNATSSLQYQEQDSIEKISTYFALQLYLDFVNIFLKLLRFMGKKKN